MLQVWPQPVSLYVIIVKAHGMVTDTKFLLHSVCKEKLQLVCYIAQNSSVCCSLVMHHARSPSAQARSVMANQSAFVVGSRLVIAGRLCNVSEIPLLCSCINWAANEVIVGSSDHALYAIDIATGQKRRTLFSKTAGHSEWVSACQYLPDNRIISGGMDSMLCVWEANSTRCQPLPAHAAPISAIDVSTALGLAASASYDKSVRLWDVSKQRVAESSCLTGHAAPVLQLACGSGSSIISGDRGGTVICWEITTQSAATKLKDAHAGHVTALAWQHDANGMCTEAFLTGGQDGHVRMYVPIPLHNSSMYPCTLLIHHASPLQYNNHIGAQSCS